MKALNSWGGDFAQALEPRYFRVFAQQGDGRFPLRVRVAVDGLLLVAHAEEGSLEDEEVALPDQLREELDEEGHQQDADVHAVVIGVRGDDHLVVAQVFQPVFNVQGMLEEVEFLVFIDDLAAHAEGVQRLAAQGEDRLDFRIPRRGDGAGGGDAFRDEEGGFPRAGVL